ncbi:MAG: cobalt transporter CbiM [Bryobacteraceae bacterium]
MHIPDGYLSPSTCAGLYAASAPFWYVALQKVKRQLHTRFVPLLSVFAAFSFVIMMFNLPLPGGTTGHATGMGVAAIVLGPWASVLALSLALLIQALFFGDGGVTALGANCFNMAIAGCLTAAFVYRAISGNAPLQSRRRVVAAGIAGYVAINVAALFTAIEFGLQPLFFHTASGAPLYAPYPLHVAVPAMMIGHLTIAGLAELLITSGVVAYLQRSDSSLLARTAPGAVSSEGTAGFKRLWVALAMLMVLTPLGLLAVGSAWGEWSPEDFRDLASRDQIARASGGVPLPAEAPSGLRRLSSVWTAPIPDYAPPVLKSTSFGYAMSAIVGTGLIILVTSGATWAIGRGGKEHADDSQ